MNNAIVDLHIHSYFSDGTMSPMEIADNAEINGVKLLAITDHNVLDGAIELDALCKSRKVRNITAVELDSMDRETDIHILAYNINLSDVVFRAFVKNNRDLLDQISTKLIEKMQNDYAGVSLAEYETFKYDCRGGGWKALHYLMDKGLTGSLFEGFEFYDKYDCTYSKFAFPDILSVVDNIHMAGGMAVLAHPGTTISTTNISAFEARILRLLDYDIDGIECYYPTHNELITAKCLEICRKRNLIITAGSDCHGSFGKSKIGETNTPIEYLQLDGIMTGL